MPAIAAQQNTMFGVGYIHKEHKSHLGVGFEHLQVRTGGPSAPQEGRGALLLTPGPSAPLEGGGALLLTAGPSARLGGRGRAPHHP